MSSREIVYRYYGDRTDTLRHNGIICVATQLKNHILTISAAFCSPKERFDKHVSRKIASGRLKCERSNLAITVKPGINHMEINEIITDNLHLLSAYPLGDRWVKKAIEFNRLKMQAKIDARNNL